MTASATKVLDYSAGHIGSREASILINALNFYDGYDPSLETEAQVQEVFAQTVNRAAAGNADAIRDLAKYMSENFYAFNIDNQEEDIYISRLNTEVLDEIYERRYINPMFVEMEFGSIEKSVLSEALTFNGDNALMKNLFGTPNF